MGDDVADVVTPSNAFSLPSSYTHFCFLQRRRRRRLPSAIACSLEGLRLLYMICKNNFEHLLTSSAITFLLCYFVEILKPNSSIYSYQSITLIRGFTLSPYRLKFELLHHHLQKLCRWYFLIQQPVEG